MWRSSKLTESRPFGALSLALIVAACGGGEDSAEDAPAAAAAPTDAGSIVMAGVGFSTPESVLHDTEADVYLVSNINGTPLDKDGNGFISRLTPDGEVTELKWIDGEREDVTLSAPKGMAILDGTLFVSDIDCVRMFDATSGEPSGDICVEGATFLNDIAAGPNGELFVTDSGFEVAEGGFVPSGSAAIHRMAPDGRQAPIAQGDGLTGANGLAVGPRGLFMVSFASGQVFHVNVDTGELTALTSESERQLDGIEFTADGGFMFSSWGDRAVYKVGADGMQSVVVADVQAPADIGYDVGRNRVLVPLFVDNEVWLVDLP
jgi:hypothetical protein